jgi:hypothetical protein
MKIFIAMVLLGLTVSGCVLVPAGGRDYRGDYRGGYERAYVAPPAVVIRPYFGYGRHR